MSLNITDPVFHDEAKARAFLEAQCWPNGPVCPFCQSSEFCKRLGGAAGDKGLVHPFRSRHVDSCRDGRPEQGERRLHRFVSGIFGSSMPSKFTSMSATQQTRTAPENFCVA